MISQPTVQSTGASTASGSIPVQPGEKWGVWTGMKVAFWDGFIPFWQSWNPDYVPPRMQSSAQPDKGPAFTFGSPDGKDGSLLRSIGLGARLVSPYTVLPGEISTMLQGFITLSAAARLRDLFGALGATKESAPGQSRADSPVDSSPTNDKDRKKKTPQQTSQRTSPRATAWTGQLPKAAVALGALTTTASTSGLTAAGAKVTTPQEMTTSAPTETADPTTEPRAISAASRFFCNNGENISISDQCNGIDDCGDNSDENCTKAECEQLGRFHCNNNKCISLDWKCDLDDDCGDNSDENCTKAECAQSWPTKLFGCNNNKCIPLEWECDLDDDCGDNSDEHCTQEDCDKQDVFRCNNNKCIDSIWQCDGVDHCGDNSDENCTQAGCDQGLFGCNNYKCISREWKCDGVDDCGDNSDEHCTKSDCEKSGLFHCNNNKCIDRSYRCDGEDDCGDGSDEQCTQTDCEYLRRRFLCDNNKCIYDDQECDGEDDCGDGSDEQCTQTNCDKLHRPFLCENNACIDPDWRCDGDDDCGDNSDERTELCNPVSSSPAPPTVMATQAPVMTVANTTMDFSGLPGTTAALHTNTAPLAATLGTTSAVAGIALGASAFLVVAGVCIYCYCHRRSSPAAADDPLEFVTVNTAGQAQEAGAPPMIKAVKEARKEPVGEQRARPPEPPGLQQRGLPEILSIPAGNPFPEELGKPLIPQHESLYEHVKVYADIDHPQSPQNANRCKVDHCNVFDRHILCSP